MLRAIRLLECPSLEKGSAALDGRRQRLDFAALAQMLNIKIQAHCQSQFGREPLASASHAVVARTQFGREMPSSQDLALASLTWRHSVKILRHCLGKQPGLVPGCTRAGSVLMERVFSAVSCSSLAHISQAHLISRHQNALFA